MTHRLADAERADIKAELEGIKKDMRRGRMCNTLAEAVDWEREFGPEMAAKFPGRLSQPSDRITFCRQLAREYGVSYVAVKAAFAGVPGFTRSG